MTPAVGLGRDRFGDGSGFSDLLASHLARCLWFFGGRIFQSLGDLFDVTLAQRVTGVFSVRETVEGPQDATELFAGDVKFCGYFFRAHSSCHIIISRFVNYRLGRVTYESCNIDSINPAYMHVNINPTELGHPDYVIRSGMHVGLSYRVHFTKGFRFVSALPRIHHVSFRNPFGGGACVWIVARTSSPERRDRVAKTGKINGDLEIFIIEDPLVTAFAKRKKVFITRGLIDHLSWAEVKSIVAHEQAHIQLKHQGKTLLLEVCLVLLMARFWYLLPLTFVLSTMLLAAYSRKNELEADKVAFQSSGPVFIEALKKLPHTQKTFRIFNSHPSVEERIASCQHTKAA